MRSAWVRSELLMRLRADFTTDQWCGQGWSNKSRVAVEFALQVSHFRASACAVAPALALHDLHFGKHRTIYASAIYACADKSGVNVSIAAQVHHPGDHEFDWGGTIPY